MGHSTFCCTKRFQSLTKCYFARNSLVDFDEDVFIAFCHKCWDTDNVARLF